MIPKEIQGIGLTEIEKQIVKVMVDGEPKRLQELAVWGSKVSDEGMKTHIHNIRKKINGSRYRIYSGYEDGQLIYRLVILLPCASHPLSATN